MCFNCMSSRNVLLFLGPFPSHAGWSLSPPATEAPWASCHFPWPAQERGVSPLSPSLLRLHSGGPSLRRREGRPPFQGERLSARGLGSSAPVPGARNSSSCYVVPSRSSGPRGDCLPSRRPAEDLCRPTTLEFPRYMGKARILPEACKRQASPPLHPGPLLPSQHQGIRRPSWPARPGRPAVPESRWAAESWGALLPVSVAAAPLSPALRPIPPKPCAQGNTYFLGLISSVVRCLDWTEHPEWLVSVIWSLNLEAKQPGL